MRDLQKDFRLSRNKLEYTDRRSPVAGGLRATVLVLLSVSFLAGCGTHMKAYPGATLPKNEIAMVFVDLPMYPRSVDGRSYPFAVCGHMRIDLLPGPHGIAFGYRGSYYANIAYSVDDARVDFVAKASHLYLAKSSTDIPIFSKRGTWRAWIEDVTTDAEYQHWATKSPGGYNLGKAFSRPK